MKIQTLTRAPKYVISETPNVLGRGQFWIEMVIAVAHEIKSNLWPYGPDLERIGWKSSNLRAAKVEASINMRYAGW